jgi:pimeloyl-ACP methyl ester carboxylesterase
MIFQAKRIQLPASQPMSLHLTETGPESAPTIVFLHGGGVGGWSWRPQVEAFRADYHCLVPDLPGHGQSEVPGPDPFAITGAARVVAKMIHERAHDGRAHLVGLSLGAQVGVAVMAVAARLVDRAVFSGASVRPNAAADFIEPLLWLYAPLKNISAVIRANQRSLGVPPEYSAEFAADTRRVRVGTLAQIMSASLRFEVPPGLTRLKNPTLVLVGEKEPRTQRRSARRLAASMAGGSAYLVRGMIHNWPLAAPELFNRTLRAWLEDTALPPELGQIPRR